MPNSRASPARFLPGLYAPSERLDLLRGQGWLATLVDAILFRYCDTLVLSLFDQSAFKLSESTRHGRVRSGASRQDCEPADPSRELRGQPEIRLACSEPCLP